MADSFGKEQLQKDMDYVAFDPDDSNAEPCQKVLAQHYDDPEQRYFNQLSKVTESYGDHSFDTVILINVFHEIEAVDWLRVLEQIQGLLKPEGELIVLEDTLIPIGEQANRNGFLVLNSVLWRVLLNDPGDNPKFTVAKHPGNQRLQAFRIQAGLLSQVTAKTREETLKRSVKQARQRITELKGQKKLGFREGKELGFWHQQLAATILSQG